MSTPTGSPTARCVTHPEAVARTACKRCGSFVCDDCLVFGEYDGLCPSCREGAVRADSGSWWAFAAIISGFLALGCAPLGLVALGLGITELVRTSTGGAGRGGRLAAGAAIVLGLAGIVLWGFLILRIAEGSLDSLAAQ